VFRLRPIGGNTSACDQSLLESKGGRGHHPSALLKMVQAYQDPKRSLHPRLYPPWREASSIDHALRNGFVGLGAGLFSACVKNAYSATTTSAVKVITIYGSTIPIYGTPTSCFDGWTLIGVGAAFAAYGFTSTLASNLRRRNDSINEFWGGASGAFVWSVFRNTSPSSIILR